MRTPRFRRYALSVPAALIAVALMLGAAVAGAPSVRLNTTSLVFAQQLLGATSGAKTVIVTNIGTAPLNVTTVTITGTNLWNFVKSSDTCAGKSIAVGKSCAIALKFKPNGTGDRLATLNIASNALNSPHKVSLKGVGIAPAVRFSLPQMSFGEVAGGLVTGSRGVTVTNSGTAPLVISSVALAGTNPADFIKGLDACSGKTLAVGASCALGVKFRPRYIGLRTAELRLASNAPASPAKLALNGIGTDKIEPESTATNEGPAPSVFVSGDRVTGSAADDFSGVDIVTVRFDKDEKTPFSKTFYSDAVVTCTTEARTECSWDAALPAEPGLYTVQITARDRATNVQATPVTVTALIVIVPAAPAAPAAPDADSDDITGGLIPALPASELPSAPPVVVPNLEDPTA